MSRSALPYTLAMFLAAALHAQPVMVSTLAGPQTGGGYVDAAGAEARFSEPRDVVVDGAGNVFVADPGNHVIRRVTPEGVVTTFAGMGGVAGSADGSGSNARFRFPKGLAIDRVNGTIYIADTGNQTIRRMTPDGVVTTIAGLAGAAGFVNGTGSAARFSEPIGLAVDAAGTIYVADRRNHAIRKITSAGVVSTIANAAAPFKFPEDVAVDANGNVFVADTFNYAVRKITPQGDITTYAGKIGEYGSRSGAAAVARLTAVRGVDVDAAGNVFVTESNIGTIRKVAADGSVSAFAFTSPSDDLASTPVGIATTANGTIFVADDSLDSIVKVTSAGAVTTLAGSRAPAGKTDGPGDRARFNLPYGVAADAAGNVYVADTDTIRKINTAGVVSTIASNSIGTHDQFLFFIAVTVDPSGNIFAVDQFSGAVDKIAPNGTVTKLATPAFESAQAIASDSLGNVYVGDTGTGYVYRIDSSGAVTKLGPPWFFDSPEGIAVDASGNIFVAESGVHVIRKITPAGVMTTFAGRVDESGSADGTGEAARFSFPRGLSFDAHGNLFVADYVNHTVRRITPAGEVTTVAGIAGSSGNVNGAPGIARFFFPAGVAVDSSGRVVVADLLNHAIRAITPLSEPAKRRLTRK